MNAFGKSIRIYLKDGTVTGIKFGEVVNQTIQSISCPRLRVSELSELAEANRPGVYFLFGEDEQTGEAKAYIGEAENVFNRLQSHISGKDFWNEVIFFVSKDENLTKSHVKYLESRLIQLAFSTKRYKVENQNLPQQSSLPLADRDAMEEFLTYIKLLIGVMGHKLLEEVTAVPQRIVLPAGDYSGASAAAEITFSLELFLTTGMVKAKAVQTDEGIVVLKGSEAAPTTTNSLGSGYRELRDRLIQNGTLAMESDKYVFQNNSLFNSSSAAGAVILGYNTSGPLNWKNEKGKTLKEIENARVRMEKRQERASAL
ncbi:GIY-YIG nuclease family protein [Flaviaesturariibacter amylovorans]|uniref:GIY-YIG nuclease family protein n=1 Tax=Flaviaesturariibacter amylovorans TaxID=1084520 RepID=A0ABP8HIB8_9BACT